MTRYELESWCEKFLKEMTDTAKPFQDLTIKALREDWSQDKLADEMQKLLDETSVPTYNDRAKQMADFIEQFAKEIK